MKHSRHCGVLGRADSRTHLLLATSARVPGWIDSHTTDILVSSRDVSVWYHVKKEFADSGILSFWH